LRIERNNQQNGRHQNRRNTDNHCNHFVLVGWEIRSLRNERRKNGGILDAANPEAGRGTTASARGRRGAGLKSKAIRSRLENTFTYMQMTNCIRHM
jgi:hypothetical protein